MQFQTYYDLISRTTKEDTRHPLIGYAIVDEPFDCSDCNLYPNHEVFGKAIPGKYPVYFAYQPYFEHHDDGKYISSEYVGLTAIGGHAFGGIHATPYDGKGGFTYPIHLYRYELKDYLKPAEGHHFHIELIEPFHLDEGGNLVGYGMSDAELKERLHGKEGK